MSETQTQLLLIDPQGCFDDRIVQFLRSTCGYSVEITQASPTAESAIQATQAHYQIALVNLAQADASTTPTLASIAGLLALLREQEPTFQWIALTEHTTAARVAALQAGAFQALSEPVSPEEAALSIERVAEHQRLLASAQRYRYEQRAAQKFATIQQVAAAISPLHNLGEVLEATCRAAVELFSVDHSGLVLFSADGERGLVVAEHPSIGAHGSSIPLRGVAVEEQLIQQRSPVVIPNVQRTLDSSPVRETLARFDIRSTLLVPVIFQDQLLGSFSLDSIGRLHHFSAEDINCCVTFASQVAIAVEHANLLEQANRRAEQLEQIRRTTLAMTLLRKRDNLLDTIAQQAVALLKAKSGGIYEYRPERGEVEIVADYGRPSSLVGQKLKHGEGMAGRLIAGDEPYLKTSDYADCADRAAIYSQPCPFGAVLEVPLIWDEQPIGVIYVDDKRGRDFSTADVETLQLLADHAAIALINANLTAGEINKRRRLEKFTRACNTIMDNSDASTLDERLALTAQYASEILEAESSGIFLIQRPGVMTLEASFGHRPGGFEKGRDFHLSLEPRAGLTGYIAAKGELFNANGAALQSHPARRGETPHTPSECFSLLAIPLKRHTDAGDELIGLLRVDNKKDRDGQPTPLIGFTEEDEWILQLFANAAQVAIENAKLVEQLREQGDYLNRMIASQPNGLIAIDRDRRVRAFNRQAAEMLQYEPSEVIGELVDGLYANPREPWLIGRKLHESLDGQLSDHETLVRSKHGMRIPIRLAATWIFDAQGRRVGSVGYFEDLRAAKETQRRLDLLLQASNIVARADNFTEGLTRLAEMLVTLLHCSFCRVFLLDDGNQHLITAAVYPLPERGGQLDWAPGLGARTAIADWSPLNQFFSEARPRVLRDYDPHEHTTLASWSRQLGLKAKIHTLVMIPLRVNDRIVGMLDLGEISPGEPAPFLPDMLHLATAIADQTAALIDRMRLYTETDRRRLLYTELDSAARQLRAEKDPARLYQTIVSLAIHLAGGNAGALFLNHAHIEEVELVVAEHFPADLGRRQQHTDGLIGHVARSGAAEIAYNYSYWNDQDPLLQPYHFQSLIAVPLRHAGEVEAVLLVAHSTNPYEFTSATQEILERFAIHASLVLRTARTMSREQRAFSHLAMLHQMSDYIQVAPNLDTLLHVTLTAMTAGYGLGFNRAAIFLLDPRREQLVGQMGIGHITPSEAERAWTEHAYSGLEDFRRYREWLEHHRRLTLTPVGEHVRRMRLSLGPIANDVFTQVIQLQKWRIVYPDEFAALPAHFAATLQITTPLVVLPLITRGNAIGLLVADNKFTREPITHELIDSLLAFANTAAIAIDTHLLLGEANLARQKLQSFYEASNTLIWSQDPTKVLREIVERARLAAHASSVSMVLFDEHERVREILATGDNPPIDLGGVVRPNGISMQVLRSGEPVVIEDAAAMRARVNPIMFDQGVAAGLCLPMSIKGQHLGVIWVHYEAPRAFPAAEIAAIQLYVNQAAIAYDNARQLDGLRRARDTALIVARVTTLGRLQPTLESIVAGTKDVLGCDAVSLYVYEHERDMLHQPPVTAGLHYPSRANRTDEHARAAESFVYAMLNVDQMQLVEDTASDPRFAGRRFTREEQIGSCVVVPLQVGAKRVGVMFINYRRQHHFLPDETTNIETFAYQAAVAIHNAQLYDQVQRRAATLQRLYEAGRAMTGTLALSNILMHIVEQACALMESYGRPSTFSLLGLINRDQLEFVAAYPPSTLPLLHTKAGVAVDLRQGLSAPIGVSGQVAHSGASQRIADVHEHPAYIAYMPDTRSELAVPLRIRDKIIGVINIEHPELNAFDEDHQQALELLAAQAAIAIENAQLFENTRGLHAITLAASAALQIDEVLRATTDSIAREFGYESVGIHLIDETSGTLSGPTYYAGVRPRKYNINTTTGITGRVARSGEAELVPDVTQDPDYIVGDKRTRSELCVPLRAEHRVVGVINVESSQLGAFTEHDRHLIETIARQVVSRIENARLYTQLEQTKSMLAARTAVAWMGMVSAIWGHEITGQATTIWREVDNIYAELGKLDLAGGLPPRLGERLQKISRVARQIIDQQLPSAPSGQEEAVSLQLHELIPERLRQLEDNGSYREVAFGYTSTLDPAITVRISREWMCTMLNILIDNAVEAMRGLKQRRIDVTLAQAQHLVEITIRDTGKGIPKKTQALLFRQQIGKVQGQHGMGMGLLLAQTIAQTYGGEVLMRNTSAKGTTMVVQLPIERALKDSCE